MKTHFNVGTDNENKTSDYAMRFQQSATNPNSVNGQLHLDNKTKIEADSTILGVPGAKIAEKTTTGENTKDKFGDSKMINSPLPSFIANNIRSTHYEIGPGGKARPSETTDSFSPRD